MGRVAAGGQAEKREGKREVVRKSSVRLSGLFSQLILALRYVLSKTRNEHEGSNLLGSASKVAVRVQ